jgi:iron(II)-dependent oxidoreductase
MNRKQDIRERLTNARQRTLRMLDEIPPEFLTRRVHDFYSPVGWHFGHIARTEEYWVCRALRDPLRDEALGFLFADLPTNPKENRANLPLKEKIVDYMRDTREHSLRALEAQDLNVHDPLLADGFAWEFAFQHECQHQETITELQCLIQREIGPQERPEPHIWVQGIKPQMSDVVAGTFVMGTDWQHAYDNEKPAHEVTVAPFKIGRSPVTAFEWSEFIKDRGYETDSLWSENGRAWRDEEKATRPEYWHVDDGGHFIYGPTGLRAIHPDEPVASVSWHEAQAFAQWRGARLPTEEERELIAHGASPRTVAPREGPDPVSATDGVGELLACIWEWTCSPFMPYHGFEAFPYDGYSLTHMDGRHYVCRGGSWATSAPILRPTFRNWYLPGYRQGFLGLRLAADN